MKISTSKIIWKDRKRFLGMPLSFTRYALTEDRLFHSIGFLNIRDDEMLVYASFDVLMRCKIADMQASELLSKDGVVITAPDLEHDGKMRTVIAYYVYHTKNL
jgi:hypothetical protein